MFVVRYINQTITNTDIVACSEINSTSQRGELLALLSALDYAYNCKENAQIITDSEYLFNAMTKEWCTTWSKKNWKTANNDPVKNKDIWLEIMHIYNECEKAGLEIVFYHIKGHAISFGKVTASTLLHKDSSGTELFGSVLSKIQSVGIKESVLQSLNDLSLKNNGFVFDDLVLNRFIAYNTVADAIATERVETADAAYKMKGV